MAGDAHVEEEEEQEERVKGKTAEKVAVANKNSSRADDVEVGERASERVKKKEKKLPADNITRTLSADTDDWRPSITEKISEMLRGLARQVKSVIKGMVTSEKVRNIVDAEDEELPTDNISLVGIFQVLWLTQTLNSKP